MPSPSVTLRQIEGYRFEIDFGAIFAPLYSDEPEPIGGGTGPSPEQLLIAGVCNCLCASLAFALGKYRQAAGSVTARASARIVRNAENRLRLAGIDVEIDLGAPAAAMPRIDQVLAQFERFCTVSESVRAGIPVEVTVKDAEGRNLKARPDRSAK